MEPNNVNENSGGMINNNGGASNMVPNGPNTMPGAPSIMPDVPNTPNISNAPTDFSAPVAPSAPIEPPVAPATPSVPVEPTVPANFTTQSQNTSNPFVNPEQASAQSEKKKSNKTLLILIIIIVVMVIAAAIVAVVMLNNNQPKSNPPAVPMGDLDDGSGDSGEAVNEPEVVDEVIVAYDKAVSDVREKIVAENIEDLTAIANLYKQAADAAENEKVKAMLMLNYYNNIMNNNVDEVTKNEILNGVVTTDDMLKTYTSAITVSKIADFYGNTEIAEQYREIAKERQ